MEKKIWAERSQAQVWPETRGFVGKKKDIVSPNYRVRGAKATKIIVNLERAHAHWGKAGTGKLGKKGRDHKKKNK